MSFDLNAILGQIGRDKGIDKTILIEAVESAMLSAARRHYGHNLNLETKYNEDTGEIEVMMFKTVVDDVIDEGTQVSVAEARVEYDPDAIVGDEFGKKLPTDILGRIAAQTAKQVIIQKVRDAERGVIFDEYKNSKGEVVNGIVQRYDKGSIIVNLGRTEAVLPKREQIMRERYRQGDRVRCMILDVDPSARGPQIILTRSHPDFLKKLFSMEVPEIQEGVVEVKAVAREAGERAKIAVISNDSGVDPVGACVGIKGSRVQAVVQELRGERIDIITWTSDEPSFVARALAPAEVARVVVDEDEHSIEVIVNDDQLSLAIGRRGQNVKLASKLTGWRIDVRSVSVAEEAARRARQSLEAIPELDFTEAERLFQHGFRNASEVAEASMDDLLEVDGFNEGKARAVIENAKRYVEERRERGEEVEETSTTQINEFEKLALRQDLKERLITLGYSDIQQVVEAEFDDFIMRGFSEDECKTIREATDLFLKGGMRRASLS